MDSIHANMRSDLAEAHNAAENGEHGPIVHAMWRWTNSEERLPLLLDFFSDGYPAAVFWRVLKDVWPSCDKTWVHRDDLLALLREHSPSPLVPDAVEPVLTIWRGCSRERMRGLSWTMSDRVAQQFARGHRNIPVPNPIVVRAEIAREHIFGFFDDREENEVLLDPDKLTQIEDEPTP
jgi:hypothetical protein